MASTQERVLQARIRLVDNFSRPLQTATRNTQRFQQTARRVSPLVLRARDMATRVLTTVVNKAKAFGKGVYSATVKVKDMASSMLNSITGKLTALAGGVTIGVALKTGLDGLGNEQMQKITIGNAIQNTGKDKDTANNMANDYYKQLEAFANATPFTNDDVAGFGVKAIQMAKGDTAKAMDYTKAQGSVKALVGDMRTAQEVSEAFFSASNGNMDSINNILGENYENFDQLIKGVNTKQKDVLGDMSNTIPGLISTIKGKASASMKEFVKVFSEPLANSFKKVIDFIGDMTPKLVEGANKLVEFFDKAKNSQEVAIVVDFLKNTFNVAFGMIKTAVESARPIVESIFNFLRDNAPIITKVVETLGSVWDAVWKTVGPLLQGAWTLVQPLLQALMDTLGGVLDMIKGVADWWGSMVDKIKNNPIVASVKQVFSGGEKVGKKNAFGSGRIARNGEIHELHQGEKVLTKNQANQLESSGGLGGNVNLNIASVTVREEADINKIAKEFVRELKLAKLGYVRG